MRTRAVWWPAIVALVLVGCHGKTETAPLAAPPASASHASRDIRVDPALLEERIRVSPVERRPLRGSLVVSAQVVADEEGEGDAVALAPGRVAELVVTDGEHVKKGQVLAWVDAPELARVTSEVLRGRARASQAARALARQLELESQQATSASAVDEARSNAESARADLIAARTVLRGLGGIEPPDAPSAADERSPIRLPVRSPIEGIVMKRLTQLGSPVVPDKPLFHVIAPARVYILAKLPETAGSLIREQTVARIRPRETSGAELDSECSAVVVRNFGIVDDARTIPLRLAPRGCSGLFVGRYVDVLFETLAPSATGVVVPKEAAVEVKGARVVFVERGQGAFEPRAVRLGLGTSSEVLVEDGLREGDRVAMQGVVLLKGELLRSELEAQ